MLTLGSQIKYGGQWWKVGAVGFAVNGERYYWLVGQNEVAMIPAIVLEG